MIEFLDIKFSQLAEREFNQLFLLRKEVFKDRLGWNVSCKENIETDEYDNEDTVYLIGVKDNCIISSNRFISMKKPNMIENTFMSCFDNLFIKIPDQIESSRFFVDKKITRKLINRKLISTLHFIAMINYGIINGFSGIYTIVNYPMVKILQRAGWNIDVVNAGKSSDKGERIYLVFLPTTLQYRERLVERLNGRIQVTNDSLKKWPLSFKITTEEE